MIEGISHVNEQTNTLYKPYSAGTDGKYYFQAGAICVPGEIP
jgi:hypothetical protein